MKWPVATIGDVCEVVSGATPKTGKPEFWDGNVPWVTPKDLSKLGQKHLSDTPRHITKAGLKSCSARMLPAQSVLLSSRAPIGLVAINTLPVCTNQGFKSLVPRFDLVSPDFLFWWLKTQEKHIQSKGRGATFKEVSKKIVENLQIPLPPLDEQKRIAEILDKADALRAKRREILAQLDTLTQSIFLDMFGDPATNPKGWPYSRLGDVTDFYAGSTLPAGDAFDGQTDGNFLLKVSDMNLAGNEVYLESCQQWSAKPGAASNTCPAGSVVIPKRGGAIGTNKKRIAVRPSVLDPNLMAIWPRPDRIELSFLYSWLLRLDLASITSGSSVPQLNKRDLDPLSIPVPPLEAQREFSHKFGAMEGVRMLHDRALSVCDTLFAALQHGAFQGEL